MKKRIKEFDNYHVSRRTPINGSKDASHYMLNRVDGKSCFYGGYKETHSYYSQLRSDEILYLISASLREYPL